MACQALLPPALDVEFVRKGPGGTSWALPSGRVEIIAESGPIRHAEPLALVALAAWAERLRRRGVEIVVSDTIKSPYSWRVGLLQALGGRTPHCGEVKEAEGWFPLCRALGSEIGESLSDNVGVLLRLPGEDSRAAIKYTVSEMVRNAHEHAKTEGPTFFAAGWFRQQGRVVFAVADAGVGIRATLVTRGLIAIEQGDDVALERAVQPRITGATDESSGGGPGNAGLGLHMTRMIVQQAAGQMIVHSGDAVFNEVRGIELIQAASHWKGTLVEVTLRPAQMPAFSPLFQSIVARSTPASTWKLQFTSAPREALELYPPVDKSGFAADKDWFAAQRQQVLDELNDRGLVSIDFAKARYSTQGALHALLFVPLRECGPAALELLWFSNAGPQIRAVINQVVSYALEQHDADAASLPQ